MKQVTQDVKDILASRQFFSADLYTFVLVGGGALRYASCDQDIVFAGDTYSSGGWDGAIIERNSNSGGERALCSWKRGLEVGTLQFDIIPRAATINGIPFLSACRKGAFDGAEFQLDRYVSGAGKSGIIPSMFCGRVAEIDAGRSYVTFNIADHRELLNISLPRNLYQSGCLNNFCDTACGLSKASFTDSGTAASGSIGSVINATLSAATGSYDLGTVTFTSGANKDYSRSVKAYVHGSPLTISLIAPFPDAPAAGDTFTVQRGCGKSVAQCTAYNNLANFRGQPFIPQATTIG